MTTFRKPKDSDFPELYAMMARAFFDDPTIIWNFPDPEVRRIKAPLFYELYYAYTAPTGHMLVSDDGLATSWWREPGDVLIDTTGVDRPNQKELEENEDLRAVHMLYQMQDAHAKIKEPHWYLVDIAVDPSMQGRGLGHEILRPQLDICDKTGVAAYLESSNSKNFGIYERLGFEHRPAIEIADGVNMYPMWRDPK